MFYIVLLILGELGFILRSLSIITKLFHRMCPPNKNLFQNCTGLQKTHVNKDV